MKVVWGFSDITETNRLLQLTSNISSGFYKNHNFWVTDSKQGWKKANTVIVPNINFAQIPGFWRRVSTIKHNNYPPIVSKQLFSSTLRLLPITTYSDNSLEQSWNKYESSILTAISNTLPSHFKLLKEITIWPTQFGTTCSFTENTQNIKIWIRLDQGLTQIIEALLSSLTRHTVLKTLRGTWSESEAIVDWLLTDSPIATLLKEIDPEHFNQKTLFSTRSHELNQKQLNHQKQMLETIGFTSSAQTQTSPLHSLPSLNQIESEIIKLLVSTKPNPVSFEDIGNLLWSKPEEKYSLTAISKHIERIRRKLELSGLPSNYIQTWRTKGYFINN